MRRTWHTIETTTSEQLTLRTAEARIAVVSDTHSQPHPATAGLLRREAPAVILHAGDIGRLTVLDELRAIAPVIAVRGNIDGRDDAPPDLVDVAVVWGGRRLNVLLTHIAVDGPRLRPEARRLAAEHGADVVVCGHSHVPLVARDGRVAVFNPGSIGPRRFGLPITFGVMDLGAAGLSFRHVDCETAERWRPGRAAKA